MAVAELSGVTFSYPDSAGPTLQDVSLSLEPGETVVVLGRSGSGKTTLLRVLAGLVPHFHGGVFDGSAVVGGHDTRHTRPAELAGTAATVFQDPEDQIVMTEVLNEVAFGLENLGTSPSAIEDRAREALDLVGAGHLEGRRTAELSGGERQRICLAAALALRPQLVLLDEPTSQLDEEGAAAFLDVVTELGACVVLSEHRVERVLPLADRVLFMEGGSIVLDAAPHEAATWLAEHEPLFLEPADAGLAGPGAEPVVALREAAFAYEGGPPVVDGLSLEVARGEIVVLEGANGCGKTTVAKLVAGLHEPASGQRIGAPRAGYVSQDPGRYLVEERVVDEVALALGGNRAAAEPTLETFDLGWARMRHPRDLSSGERERLGIAAVSVAEPELLVLDEPTRGIDPVQKQRFVDWLVSYAAEGRAVVVATHDRSIPAHRRIRLGAGEAVRV